MEQWTEDLIGSVAKGIHRVGQGKGIGGWELTRSAAIALARIAPSLRFVGQPEVAEAAESTAQRLWEAADMVPILRPSAGAGGESSLLWRAIGLRASVMAGSDSAVEDLLALARSGNLGVLGAFEDANGNPTGELAVTRRRSPRAAAVISGGFPRSRRARVPAILVAILVRQAGRGAPDQDRLGSGVLRRALARRPSGDSVGDRTGPWHPDSRRFTDCGVHPRPERSGPGPHWRSAGWSGEALLSPVTVSEQVIAEIAERGTPRMSVQLGMKKPKRAERPGGPAHLFRGHGHSGSGESHRKRLKAAKGET